MNKVIVTGATGFLGSSLVRTLLKNKYEIGIIIRFSSDLSNLNDIKNKINVFQYNGDIESLISVFKKYKPQQVIHLASNFIAEHKTNQVNSLIQSNITFGLHLLEAMKVTGLKDLINTGTSWQHYNNEDYNPVCLYAATKQAFESLLEYYVQAEAFRVITLKLFDTYGESDNRPKLINILNKLANEQTELNMSAGEQLLSLVHVSDVCKAFMLCINILNKDEFIGSKSYSLRNNEFFMLKDVIKLFEKVTSKKINIKWGAKPYRKREVMKLWDRGENLPNWKPQISLIEGLKLYK